jgi:hypothetical protein
MELFGGWFLRWRAEQPATECELGGALAVGEEAVVADAMKAVRQGVQQETPDDLVGGKRGLALAEKSRPYAFAGKVLRSAPGMRSIRRFIAAPPSG